MKKKKKIKNKKMFSKVISSEMSIKGTKVRSTEYMTLLSILYGTINIHYNNLERCNGSRVKYTIRF